MTSPRVAVLSQGAGILGGEAWPRCPCPAPTHLGGEGSRLPVVIQHLVTVQAVTVNDVPFDGPQEVWHFVFYQPCLARKKPLSVNMQHSGFVSFDSGGVTESKGNQILNAVHCANLNCASVISWLPRVILGGHCVLAGSSCDQTGFCSQEPSAGGVRSSAAGAPKGAPRRGAASRVRAACR